MKTYLVTLPIAGSISGYFQADNKKDAIKAALNTSWFKNLETTPEFELDDINSYDALYRENINMIEISEAEAEEQEEGE